MKKQNFAKRIISTTFIVLLVVAAVSAAMGKNIFTDLYTRIASPFQQATTAITNGTTDSYSKSREELIAENEQLKQEINDLAAPVIDYDYIKKENAVLRKYYGIKDENPNYNIAVATVIRRDPNDDFYGFTIDKGSRDDVKVNDPVITDNGLVGWISEVNVTTSKVTTLLSPEAKVGAIDKKSGDSGIATGSSLYSEKGLLMLSVISADNTIKKGDIIITTGVGGVYPPDIIIGRVMNLDYNKYDTTPYAVIQPYEDIKSISDVVVITSFEGQGVIEAASDTDTGK